MYIITDEQIAADEATFAAFHRLRKHNSTRRERQRAWAATEVIIERRRDAARRMRPVAPAYRWFDVDDTAPAGWTYPIPEMKIWRRYSRSVKSKPHRVGGLLGDLDLTRVSRVVTLGLT
jgi:hypothetical protein